MSLGIKNGQFIDDKGRIVLLRGVNLGGSSKVPLTPNGATHIKTNFIDHRDVSFVGRPFPIKEADEHFSRLKHWGFNSIRFLVTWEAIEHRGPKMYDKEYLDYLEEILKLAEENEFYIFIDPHQDVWSRITGGDGAPGWTFEKVGLDYTTF
ncbi:MAG: cellulase family glycosylhydrolase, partial [Candidatus Hermodarchaeota archaeon]